MISMLPGGDKEVPFHHWKLDTSHHLLAACHSTFYSWARKQDERKHLYSSNNCSYWNCIINIYLGVFQTSCLSHSLESPEKPLVKARRLFEASFNEVQEYTKEKKMNIFPFISSLLFGEIYGSALKSFGISGLISYLYERACVYSMQKTCVCHICHTHACIKDRTSWSFLIM